MLFVADVNTKKILFRVDAWQANCTELVERFVKDNHLNVINEEVTMMGDMIIWIK